MAIDKSNKVHNVKATLNVKELTKAGSSLKLELSANNRRLGELQIGQGSLYWRGKNRKVYKRIDWTSFAEWMNKEAYGE
jgi:hypothetical protein